MIRRRDLVRALAAVPVFAGAGVPAHAQPFDPPRIYYGFPPGSAGDTLARRVADRLAGSPYARSGAVVENKPGAGGRLALDALRAAPADGSVLTMTPMSCVTIYPHVYTKLGYEPARDFTAVSTAAAIHHGLGVGPLVPASVTDLKSFLAWAKANPDKANFGSPGAGSTPHFLGALLGLQSGVDIKHVPYRGTAPGITDAVGGQVAAMVSPSGDFLAHVKTGKLRLLATSGRARSVFSPEVATFAEQGFGDLTVEEWFAFFAPVRTPPAVVAAASAAIQQALADKAMVDALGTFALQARGSTPDELARIQRSEFERWGPLVKRVGFTSES